MTLFEIIIICIVAAMFVATIFMFVVYIKYIKKFTEIDKQVLTMSNTIYECRSFLCKISKHDVLVRIDKITDLEKKIGEIIGVCKNQTNNITQVSDNLDRALEDIKMRNKLIADNHKLLDNISKSNSSSIINKNIFTAYEDLKDKLLKIDQQYTIIADNLIKFSSFKFNKIVEDITYIKEKLGETSVDSKKEVIDIDKKLADILSWTKKCKSGIEALVEGHNKGIDATRKAFEVINSRNDITDNAINKTYDDIKSVLKDIAKISSVLDSYREKINYITTYIENATKLKTASKTKMVQTKTTTTPITKKGVQKYL